jgi:hypothetical protein
VAAKMMDDAPLPGHAYHAGRGFRGSNEWTPVAQIVDALDAAFYQAFEVVQPTGSCSGSTSPAR